MSSRLKAVIIPLPSEKKCRGSLKVTHEDDDRNISHISLDSKDRKKYENLRIGFPVLQRNSVSILTIKGDCCWEVYAKSKFHGEKKIVSPGDNKYDPDFQPISIYVNEC